MVVRLTDQIFYPTTTRYTTSQAHHSEAASLSLLSLRMLVPALSIVESACFVAVQTQSPKSIPLDIPQRIEVLSELDLDFFAALALIDIVVVRLAKVLQLLDHISDRSGRSRPGR